VTSYQVGRLLGTLIIPALVVGLGGWFSLMRKRSGPRRWWTPLAVGLLIAFVLVAVTVIGRLGQLPQELEPTAALVHLPGYVYEAPDREAEGMMEARFRSDTDLGNEITGLLLRQIVHRDDGSFAGVITVVGLEPAAAAGNTHLDVARGLGQSGSGFVEETQIAGWPVGVVDSSDELDEGRTPVWVTWVWENLFFVLVADGREAAESLAGEIISRTSQLD
jgi:hypothetical protein